MIQSVDADTWLYDAPVSSSTVPSALTLIPEMAVLEVVVENVPPEGYYWRSKYLPPSPTIIYMNRYA